MNPAQHPLTGVKAMLQDIAADGDAARLAECLEGRHLPAMGGHEHPADLLHRALSLPPYDPELARRLTALIGELTEQRAESLSAALESPGAELLEDELYVFNLFLFASYLPADERLFSALETFHDLALHTATLSAGGGRVGRQLRQALTTQQVDDRLEEFWMALIEQVAHRPGRGLAESLTTEEKGDLLDAWRGLLWIPPAAADREVGKTLAVQRVLAGLSALDEAVGDQADGLPVLRYVVRQLNEAYPRSPEFWSENLGASVEGWSSCLRGVIVEQWPTMKFVDQDADIEYVDPAKYADLREERLMDAAGSEIVPQRRPRRLTVLRTFLGSFFLRKKRTSE